MARDVYAEILRLRQEGKSAALATIVLVHGSSPASIGTKMLVTEDELVAGTVGGGCLEADVFAEAREAMRTERPRVVSFTLTEEHGGESGLTCGGTVEIFIEPLVFPTLYLFGGGHVGRAICETAALAGFSVWVIDDREAFASPQRHPAAARTISGPFEEVCRSLAVGENSYVALVTRGHQYDEELLAWAVGTRARYIGMIGSRRKVLRTYENLAARGIDPAAFDRVRAPIGLDIGAVTAAEIAVSVVAELVGERRSGTRKKRKGERRPRLSAVLGETQG